jgi:serine/threonine-protein kinase
VVQSAAFYELEAGNYRNGEALSAEALAIAKRNLDSETAWIYKHLGEAQDGAEDLSAAWQNFSAGRNAARKENGGQGPTAQLVDLASADFLARTSRLTESFAIAQPASEMAFKLSRQGITTSLLPSGVINYGGALIQYGRFEQGLDLLGQAEAMRANLPPALKQVRIQLFEERGAGFIEEGRYVEAESLFNEAAETLHELNREHTPLYNRNLLLRAHLLNVTGRNVEALKTLGDYKVFSAPGRVSRSALEELIARSEISLSAGDFSSGRELAAQARAEITSSPNRPYLALWEARAALAEGRAELSLKEARAALPLLQRSAAIRNELLDPNSPALADAYIALGECRLGLGERKAGSALLARAEAIHASHPRLGEQYRRPLKHLERIKATAEVRAVLPSA